MTPILSSAAMFRPPSGGIPKRDPGRRRQTVAPVIELHKKGTKRPDRGELAECSDADLLTMVQSQPLQSGARQDACAVLIGRYQGLVRSCVLRYKDSPEPTEELMQVGYVGLLKAINNFDAAFGGSLAAYAQPCISGEIKRHFRDKRWQVHVKRSVQELVLDVRAAARQLTHDLGRLPSESDLAQHLGISSEDLRDARQA